MKGLNVFEPPRYMTVNQALEQLTEIEGKRNEKIVESQSRVVGVARLGQPLQRIVYGTVEELLRVDFGEPLHSLVIVGETHFMENEVLDFYKFNESTPLLPEKKEINANTNEEESDYSDTEYGL